MNSCSKGSIYLAIWKMTGEILHNWEFLMYPGRRMGTKRYFCTEQRHTDSCNGKTATTSASLQDPYWRCWQVKKVVIRTAMQFCVCALYFFNRTLFFVMWSWYRSKSYGTIYYQTLPNKTVFKLLLRTKMKSVSKFIWWRNVIE